MIVYVGTYTERILFGTGEVYQGKGQGIYRFALDPDTGRLQPCGLTPGVLNPSFLALDPRRGFLLAVNELEEFEGQATGTLSAFAVDPADGSLTLLSRQPTRGTDPCHVVMESGGRYALVSNYMSGSLSVLPLAADGRLGEAVGFAQHEGRGPHPLRQRGPHVHSVTLLPGEGTILVADLGLDRLVAYRFDPESGELEADAAGGLQLPPGAGPRHLALHPDERHAYLVNELNSTVVALQCDSRGRVALLDTCPTLPQGFSGQNIAADIHLTPDGRFLYVSNRGHDSIATYAVEPGSGRLRHVGHTSAQGRTPRNFAVVPEGGLLLVANQDSDLLVSFRIDLETGGLEPTGHVAEVPNPVCVLPAAL
jgi:6-phosphogluconolactonase